MGISQKDIKLLWGKAASRCCICRIILILEKKAVSTSSVLGEQAHIVAEELNGPRGNSILTVAERNSYGNLILLCPNHHSLIDKNVEEYPVEKLHIIKARHELWVEQTLERDNTWNNPNLIQVAAVLRFMAKIQPILLWLHRIVPRENALKFFEHLQLFWCSYNIAHENIDRTLTQALDRLLRPLAVIYAHYVVDEDKVYAESNLYKASTLFERYFTKKGFGWVNSGRGEGAAATLRDLSFSLELVSSSQNPLNVIELDVVHHAQHILRYYERYIRNRGHIEIPESLVDQFFELLGPFLSTDLRWQLPKKLDEDSLYEIRTYCGEMKTK